ncbi:MAG: 16S rRNA (cytosine(1402)-N(4))-methyltransferase RsmH [Firmicutes bacterium]|nr:16S rRNA (cytosine(1402)-N(4))-methyltransferase RsmH [Bacillota bacterium]
MTFQHTPVLLDEVISNLELKKGNIVVDATFGGGGHARAILERIGNTGKLIAIDQDTDAINNAKQNGIDAEFHHTNFANLEKVLRERKVDAILADIGVSSYQIDEAERGFSYMLDAPLDMRMNKDAKLNAWHIVNKSKESELEKILKDYGEERYAKKIAASIASRRPINTTLELAKICEQSVPGTYYKFFGHPAKKTFQAIRIAVNDELGALERFLPIAIESLNPDGKIAIITFHSLEDRIVKQTFKTYAATCHCPPKTPLCICGHTISLKILTKKPIVATDIEVKANPRSASAKLRVAVKL